VGNRTQQSSTLPAITSGGFGYDADDRFTAGDTYDANGNTVSSGGIVNVYDFENHLVQQGSVKVVYDGDGNRAEKIAAGVTTVYVTASVNPTGYAQVVEENFSGSTTESIRYFVYGLERISQRRQFTNGTQTSYYVYDGHGSTRALTDPTSNVTDTYDYDAFGNEIHAATTLSTPTPNEFLFAGEQYDSDLHLYYNRARYLNVTTGRFWTMDTFEGDHQSPPSLHKYLYGGGDPVNRVDPSGDDDIAELTTAFSVAATISSMSNVLVAGVYSALTNGLPDAVGFGAFVAGPESWPVPLIAGIEILFAPRLKTVVTYVFGGAEPSKSASLGIPPILMGHQSVVERGAFAVWYWNLHDLSTDVFGIAGISAGGGFIGGEASPGKTSALLFGVSSDLDASLFGVAGGAFPLVKTALSEGAMEAEAGATESAFSLLGLIESGRSIGGAGGLAAAILNGAAVATWVHYTYGKQ
jgi:RHS repeat-associated protein